MIINKSELHILLNQFMLRDLRTVDVEYPLLSLPLFTIDLDVWRVENIVSRADFDAMRHRYAKTPFLRDELPNYHDLIDVFVSSGAVDFDNQKEIDNSLNLLRTSIQDSNIYVKPVFIGIDTNIAYYRIISRRLNHAFKYVISDIVVEEIDARIHTKYTSKMLRKLEALPNSKIVREFSNGSAKDARKAKNAMNEIYYLINMLDAFRIGSDTGTKDKEVRDREIIKQYAKFSDEINAEVVVLTADKDMIFHAKASELSSVYFALPHSLSFNYTVDPEIVPNLIHDLVLVFGAIRIGDYLLLGEWRGKTSEDYFMENLKVYNVDPELIEDIKVCRGVINEFQRTKS